MVIKKLFLLVLSFIGILLLTQCEKPESVTDLANPANQVEDHLTFSSSEEFKSVTTKISKMTEQELAIWEKQNDLVSYRTILAQANQEWEALNSAEDRLAFLNKYQDILTLRDEELVPRTRIHLYQSIINREGIYQTNGYLNKVVGDYIITVKKEDYKILKNLPSLDALTNGRLTEKEGMKIFKFTDTAPQSNARTKSTCSNYMEAEYYHNNNNCRNDRRVYIGAESYTLFYSNGWYEPHVQIRVWGRKRSGTFCNWSNYSTSLHYQNVSFTVSLTYAGSGSQSVQGTLSDLDSPGDVMSMATDVVTGSASTQPISSAFTQVHAEARSRGTNNNFAVIDCQ